MPMIQKPAILITSLGRTGTEFFAKFFADIIPNSTSLHEPDIVQFVNVTNKPGTFLRQVRRAGAWRMVVLKTIGKWTLIKLSDARLQGKLNDHRAAKELYGQRAAFISRLPGPIYIESNFGYYGLLDILPSVFAHHKAVFIVRDGRDWVRSAMNWGEAYGKDGLRRLIGHNWPVASARSGDPLASRWEELPRFDRLCWAWSRLNDFATQSISRNPNARLFRFENIFTGKDRYEYLDGLVAFATSLEGFDASLVRSSQGWLERKIHPSADGFPDWKHWSTDQKFRFEQICGETMKKLNYEL